MAVRSRPRPGALDGQRFDVAIDLVARRAGPLSTWRFGRTISRPCGSDRRIIQPASLSASASRLDMKRRNPPTRASLPVSAQARERRACPAAFGRDRLGERDGVKRTRETAGGGSRCCIAGGAKVASRMTRQEKRDAHAGLVRSLRTADRTMSCRRRDREPAQSPDRSSSRVCAAFALALIIAHPNRTGRLLGDAANGADAL